MPKKQSSVSNSTKEENNGLAIAGFVVGLVAILFVLIAPLALVLAIVAIVLSSLGLRKTQNKGLAVAGLVIGIVMALVSLVVGAIMLVGIIALKSDVGVRNQMREQLVDKGGDLTAVVQNTKYGTFNLPTGWQKMAQNSTDKKSFYIPTVLADQKPPFTNISVETGENRYGVEEHAQFREAILRQLAMQNQSGSKTNMNGSGSNTAHGDILYTFELKDDDTTTIQYYIVGDKKYVLIQVTDFMEPEAVDVKAAAKEIIDSFVWE